MIPLICAPMATLSHEAFRRAVERFGGCNEYVTEMINAPSLVNGGPFERYYLLSGPAPHKLVWQLTGSRAEALAKAVPLVAEKGGIGVDINMGCSAPQIYKTGAGIAWMLKPAAETREAVRVVKAALNEYERQTGRHLRLSVKCRLGAEGFGEGSLFAFTDMLAEEGVEQIALHPRTMKEKYRRPPKYEYVEKLSLRYESAGIPVILNGSIQDGASADLALRAAPHAAGLMLARAAAQKPWIFDELRRHFAGEQAGSQRVDCEQLALDFIADVERCQPPEFHKTRLQRFFAYYCRNFSFAHYFQTQMLNAASVEDSRARVRNYFRQQPGDRYRQY